jgi:hypothetical protein
MPSGLTHKQRPFLEEDCRAQTRRFWVTTLPDLVLGLPRDFSTSS